MVRRIGEQNNRSHISNLLRATTSTNLNEHSSRSHSILIVHVTTTSDNGVPITGKLYLVDLAGSERMDKSGVTGQAMKETQHINKSLSSLGDVMEGLDKKSKHIPYRNSKLTYLLQDSLGGNSKTMMIVTVCPTELTADETFFALQVCVYHCLVIDYLVVRHTSQKYSIRPCEEKYVLEDLRGITEGHQTRIKS